MAGSPRRCKPNSGEPVGAGGSSVLLLDPRERIGERRQVVPAAALVRGWVRRRVREPGEQPSHLFAAVEPVRRLAVDGRRSVIAGHAETDALWPRCGERVLVGTGAETVILLLWTRGATPSGAKKRSTVGR